MYVTHPQPVPVVPEETVRVAHAVFPRDNVSPRMRDKCGAIFGDDAFAARSLTRRQPAEATLATGAGARTNGSQVYDLGTVSLSGIGNSNRVFVDIHADEECARLRQS